MTTDPAAGGATGGSAAPAGLPHLAPAGADGVSLTARTCLRRLDAYGVRAETAPDAGREGARRIVTAARERPASGPGLSERERPASGRWPSEPRPGVECELSSFGPASFGPASWPPPHRGGEPLAQAMSGLMAVNGKDQGRPARIGLEVASVTGGILATQSLLALLVGRSRGAAVRTASTSLLQAALLLCSHYVAAATGEEDPTPAGAEPTPGPPFRSADGWWFELETLDPQVWRSFWGRLGAPDDVLGRAWTRFRPRYFAGTCTLPHGLHEAASRHSLAELSAVAESCGVSLLPVRGYAEVVAEFPEWRGSPSIEPLDSVVADSPHPADSVFTGSPPRPAGCGDTADHAGPAAIQGELPLEGLLVVEATNRMQGPLAGLLLRMLGATVVKVEPPGGDPGRMVPPMAGDTGSFFRCFNRGKESVEIDLTTPSGRAELTELAARADVFLHNWRPGRERKWSLGPEDLARHNPGLVYAQASGWGGRSDLDHILGMDFLVQAFTGMGYALRPATEPPRTSRLTLTDFTGALVACEGILAALYRREGDGRGRRVGSSLLAGGVALQAHVLDGLATGHEAGRSAGRPVWGPLDVPIETADGVLVVSVAGDDDLRRLAGACGVDPGAGPQDPGAEPQDPGAELQDLERRVAVRLAAGTAEDWRDTLARAGLASTVARTDLAALPDDPALGGLFDALGGGSRAPASPWSFDR